uniref:hypothetical protein n=1 Tax=Nostoc sp. CMAA1605 TaxID=2055159 RepID=UPI002E37E41D|nr:hypothetical protein [Nostoc sp. CMAA1605]
MERLLRLGTRDWGLGTGDWGLGTGDWGLGTGDWGLGEKIQCPIPMPNAQCPMPNAQCPMPNAQSLLLGWFWSFNRLGSRCRTGRRRRRFCKGLETTEESPPVLLTGRGVSPGFWGGMVFCYRHQHREGHRHL